MKTVSIEQGEINAIVWQSLQEYNSAAPDKQKRLKSHVERQIANHNRGLDLFYIGLDEKMIKAAELFLKKIK